MTDRLASTAVGAPVVVTGECSPCFFTSVDWAVGDGGGRLAAAAAGAGEDAADEAQGDRQEGWGAVGADGRQTAYATVQPAIKRSALSVCLHVGRLVSSG